MNRDLAKGCGCFAGLLAALAALGVGGFVAIAAVIRFVGWPVALAIALALTGAAVALVYFAIRFIVGARQRSRTIGPYRAKLAEIDKLAADVEAAVSRVAGSDYGAGEIRSRLEELKRRRDAVLRALIEVDEFLRAPANRDFRMRTESTFNRMRERLAGGPLKQEYADNATRLDGVRDAVAKVKAERQALIANLDRIAIGLREIRARMLPTATAAASRDDIAQDLSRLTDAIVTETKIQQELSALEQPEDPRRPPPAKQPH